MRILYCNKYNFRFSGTESYIFDAMQGMRDTGHEVALFSMADPRGGPSKYDQHLVPPVDFESPTAFLRKAKLAGHAIYSIAARRKLQGMIGAFRPDVAHVRNIYHHLSPSILWELKAHRIPVVYHVNDFKLLCPAYNLVSPEGDTCERCFGGRFRNAAIHGCHRAGRLASTLIALEAYSHRWLKTYEKCVDLILAPSQFVHDKLVSNGWPAARIEVLPHFQDLPWQTLPNPGPSGNVLYFGRLSPEKGVQDLIAAIALVPEVRLVIAGEGPQRPELEHQAHSLQLRNVTFMGHVSGDALESLIARSQFTVFPSRAYETFGKSIVESYAQARAVVASDLGSRRELVQHGATGLLYAPKNVEQLTNAIRHLHQHPALSKSMGEAGYDVVRSRFGREQHLLALTQVYERLKPKPPATVGHQRDQLQVAFIGGRGVANKYSGVETWYEQVGARLATRGHAITVYSRKHFTPTITEYKGMRVLRLPAFRTKHLETITHSLLSTMHACFSRSEIVHYHTLGPSLCAFIPRLFGKKTIVTVQGLDWQRKKWSWFARTVLRGGEFAAAHFPNETLVVSRELQSHFRKLHAKETTYIPNGTELRQCCSGASLQILGLTPQSYILFLGRLSPEKNCDLLIEAFEGMPETEMKLVLAGGSSHSDEYVSRLRKHESGRIIFLDWLSGDTLDEVLTNASVLVLPSDLEGMSLALLDAMGAGVCVLASDIPENREVIGDSGFLFRPGDPRDLRRALLQLLSAPQLRAGKAEKARERVRDDYLWDTVAMQNERTYHEVRGERLGARATSRKPAAA